MRLALTGLNVTFGKILLRPLIGPEAFTTLSETAKYVHNFISFPFVLGLILIAATWMRDNVPRKVDIEWLKQGGGFIRGRHPTAGRFNVGEKLVFWLALAAGAAVAISGYLLMFPFYGTNILGMQAAQVVHSIIAMLFIALIIGHLHRHAGDGGRIRSHGNGQRRPQLGETAPCPVAAGRDREGSCAQSATARLPQSRRVTSQAGVGYREERPKWISTRSCSPAPSSHSPYFFHIIFPTFTIGLSAYIATLLVMWMRTGKERYRELAQFWTKVFAVSFAMGVVSGIVLSYQFGTNWQQFSIVIGSVVGPMMAYEVLVAFFLEATFLGVMLFGWNRVQPWLHTLSAIVVAFETLLSSFWILSANSWMQTPAGYEMREGIAYPVDWLAIVFNPSFPHRLAHMVTAAYLTTSFVVLAVGARYLSPAGISSTLAQWCGWQSPSPRLLHRCSSSSAISTASYSAA